MCTPARLRLAIGLIQADFTVETGQARVAGKVTEHGRSSLLHDTVWGQLNGLKCAEIHQGHPFVITTANRPLAGLLTPVERKVKLKS